MCELPRRKIAVLCAGINKEYQNKILRGIIAKAQSLNFDICIYASFGGESTPNKNDAGEDNIFMLPNFARYDGVIALTNTIQTSEYSKELIERLKASNIPFVDIDNKTEGGYYISTENYPSMRRVVEHFVKHHGFTRINFVTGPSENPEAEMRFNAYKEVLAENGIPFDEERVFYGNFFRRKGREAVLAFLKSDRELPQAIICANDNMALSAYAELIERGYKVPEDVAISGFDNTEEAQKHYPQFTTVDRPLFRMGECACEKLFKHFGGVEQPVDLIIESSPVFSETCGCKQPTESNLNEFKNMHYGEIERLSNFISESNIMQNALTGASSFGEFVDRLKPFIEKLNCERFYLCLCDGWDKSTNSILGGNEEGDAGKYLTKGYTEKMSVGLAYANGKFTALEGFETARLIVDPTISNPTANVNIVSPIHFHDRNFGYTIICNSQYPFENVMYHSWLMNIANALEITRKNIELTQMVEKLDELYVLDTLTGLRNRRGFERDVKPIYKECARGAKSVALLFIDLDGLKTINDAFGHDEGDTAIKALAGIIRDASGDDFVSARFGGDEFMMFAPDISEKEAQEACDRIQAKIAEHNARAKSEYSISASIGLYVTKASADKPVEECISIADGRMYKQKYLKKNKKSKLTAT